MAADPATSLASRLQAAQRNNDILVAPGVYDALSASIATSAGFDTLYLSGAAIAYCRQQQLLAAAEIAEVGWNERRAVLGMADYFAEEFLLEQGLAAAPDICRESPDCPDGA